MRTVKIQQLSREAFSKYGEYVQILRPDEEFKSGVDFEFFPDLLQTRSYIKGNPSFCLGHFNKREMVVTESEYHDYACEIQFPIDGDVVFHVAPANNGTLEPEAFEAFLVPKGTLICMKPGVWHYGGYAVDKDSVNCLIVLPERTFMKDAVVVKHEDDQVLKLEF